MIYKRFGPKPALLKAVFDVSVAGDDDRSCLRTATSSSSSREEWQDSPEGWPQAPTYSRWATSEDIAALYGPDV